MPTHVRKAIDRLRMLKLSRLSTLDTQQNLLIECFLYKPAIPHIEHVVTTAYPMIQIYDLHNL